MNDNRGQSQPTTPRTLSGLPTELRLLIWRHVFRSVQVHIERGPERVEESVTELDSGEGGFQISFHSRAKRAMSPMPRTPNEVVHVKLTCRAFALEIGNEWHSMITYNFKSTVAFVDVLSQWPPAKIAKLRYAYVRDMPFPIYPYDDRDCYYSFQFSDVLRMFPGLRLETLTVENFWLYTNGQELGGYCNSATVASLRALLFTKGWRQLEFVSGILPLAPVQQRQIEEAVNIHRSKHNEPDFAYGFGKIRPQIQHSWLPWADGTMPNQEEANAEVREWYNDHPEAGPMRQFPEGIHDWQVGLWARRGATAGYAEDGSGLDPKIQSLLAHMTWKEVRDTDDYLVDDGLDDPLRHL